MISYRVWVSTWYPIVQATIKCRFCLLGETYMISPPFRWLQLANCTIVEKSSGVDNNIHTTEFLDSLLKDRSNVFLFGDVTCRDQRVALEMGSYLFELFCVAANEHHTFGADLSPGFSHSL